MELFRLHAEYFPKETQDFLPKELILECGVLPLGSKKKTSFFFGPQIILNLGFLKPKEKEKVRRVCDFLRDRRLANTFHVYQIDPLEYSEIVQKIYGILPARLV